MEAGVGSFLEQLQGMAPEAKQKKFINRKTVEKIWCGFQGNHGRYQIFPVSSVVTGNPFVSLLGTREIKMPQKNVKPDGQEKIYSAFIRILPKEAYDIKDPTSGQLVSSLSAEDERLHQTAIKLWQDLYTELDVYNTKDQKISEFIRRKNYTIWNAHAVSYWEMNSTSAPKRTNFSALFVMTAKNFVKQVSEGIENTTMMVGGDQSWIEDIYCSRKRTGRKGVMMFNISKSDGPGFNISVSNIPNFPAAATVEIPEEDMEVMQNPVEQFLGWQAGRDLETPAENRKLFNARLYSELIQYMTDQLTQIRISKQNGGSLVKAIENTNQMVLKNQPATNTQGVQTNDPILSQMSQASAASEMSANDGSYGNTVIANNPTEVINSNSDPYTNPPVAHIDPLSGTPVQPTSDMNVAGIFKQPSFVSDDNMPF